MNPANAAGTVFRLAAGTTYDWKFETVANMAPDADGSHNVIWQIQEDKTGTAKSLAALGTQNINDGLTVWYFRSGDRMWKGTYTQGETDNWEIQFTVAGDTTSTAKLWRNGTLVATQSGAKLIADGKDMPSWNFGPYEPDWKPSKLRTVDFVFNQMDFGVITP